MPRLLLVLVVAAGGCVTARPPGVDTVAPPDGAAYELGCGDVVAVRVAGRPDLDCVAAVDLDGGLPLGPAGRPAAAGGTLAELHANVAETAGVPADAVSVELADARAGRVYVVGPENKARRAVPYLGPERVVAFLFRAGAVTPGCSELRDVHVVRPNVAVGGPAETVRVDVAAVVRDGDDTTNVVLRPSDIVTVGETRRSRFSRLLPAWVRPGFCRLVGVWPAPTPWW